MKCCRLVAGFFSACNTFHPVLDDSVAGVAGVAGFFISSHEAYIYREATERSAQVWRKYLPRLQRLQPSRLARCKNVAGSSVSLQQACNRLATEAQPCR